MPAYKASVVHCNCSKCGGKDVSERTYRRHAPLRLTVDTRIYLEELRQLNTQQTPPGARQPRRESQQQSREPENRSIDVGLSAAEEDNSNDVGVEAANDGEDEDDFENMGVAPENPDISTN